MRLSHVFNILTYLLTYLGDTTLDSHLLIWLAPVVWDLIILLGHPVTDDHGVSETWHRLQHEIFLQRRVTRRVTEVFQLVRLLLSNQVLRLHFVQLVWTPLQSLRVQCIWGFHWFPATTHYKWLRSWARPRFKNGDVNVYPPSLPCPLPLLLSFPGDPPLERRDWRSAEPVRQTVLVHSEVTK